MALDNVISVTFTEEEVAKMTAAIESINQVLASKAVNLTPEERKQYGSIADKNKILVDKAKFYMDKEPNTIPRTINKAEFDGDYLARIQIEEPYRRLNLVMEKLSDTKTLLDFDNFQATLAYYRYVKYLSEQNEPGTTSIYQDLRRHYSASVAKKVDEKATPAAPETPAPAAPETPAAE